MEMNGFYSDNENYNDYVKGKSVKGLLEVYQFTHSPNIIEHINNYIITHGLDFLYPEIILSFRNVMYSPELVYKKNEMGQNCLHLLFWLFVL